MDAVRAMLGEEWRERNVGGDEGWADTLYDTGLVAPGLGGAREINEGRARRGGGRFNEWSLASELPFGDGRASVEIEAKEAVGIGMTESDRAARRASSSSFRPAWS